VAGEIQEAAAEAGAGITVIKSRIAREAADFAQWNRPPIVTDLSHSALGEWKYIFAMPRLRPAPVLHWSRSKNPIWTSLPVPLPRLTRNQLQIEFGGTFVSEEQVLWNKEQ